jgi:DNA-directed RNA polymerase specialized sigma24 family protein
MVLALRFFEDMPYAEIARILGWSEFRVRLKFITARRALVRELKRLGAGRIVFVLSLTACGLLVLTSNAAA